MRISEIQVNFKMLFLISAMILVTPGDVRAFSTLSNRCMYDVFFSPMYHQFSLPLH